jgi:hypothetical protein
LWCTVAGPGLAEPPTVVKQVFTAMPAGAVAGPGRFAGEAVLSGQAVQWDLAVTADGPALRHLRPAPLYGAPLPRTKLEAPVPHGSLSGTLRVGGTTVEVAGWPGTVGHNWGSEHADSWVWLHADGLGESRADWLELALARIRAGRVLLPWTAFGAVSLGGARIALGGLGRAAKVSADATRLTAAIHAPGGPLRLTVTADPRDTVALRYADPAGGSRLVSHCLRARAELVLNRGAGGRPLTAALCAYEYGTAHAPGGTEPRSLPQE